MPQRILKPHTFGTDSAVKKPLAISELLWSGHDVMAEWARETLLENSDLAQEFHSGRTLLHAAPILKLVPVLEKRLCGVQ